MVSLYHVNLARRVDLVGRPYRGSWRDDLSALMGGEVGFAYAYLPESWRESLQVGWTGYYRLVIPDDALVIVARPGWDIPRIMDRWTRWEEMCEILPAAQVVGRNEEVAFLAQDVTIVALLDKEIP